MVATAVRGIFLDNRFTVPKGRDSFEVVNPADLRPIGRVTKATAEDAREAMDSAASAQPKWESVGAAARAKVLTRAAESLRPQAEEWARLITQEMGKVLPEARSEVAGAIDNFDYYAAFARTLSGEEVSGLPTGESLRLVWLPRGVVVAITPWNFPAATVTRKIAPALLGGNTMVL
ncbi:MAG TPA: aldehyde dehydrogenase family protein, partial [Thermoplasmata archaeon]|nr:aldehyde dehydrogenase family protein [Thermoplasmata archaeon]